jgi:hypothetical protein
MRLAYLVFLMGFCISGLGILGILVGVVLVGNGCCSCTGYVGWYAGFDSFLGFWIVGSCLYFVSVGAGQVAGNAVNCGRCQTI